MQEFSCLIKSGIGSLRRLWLEGRPTKQEDKKCQSERVANIPAKLPGPWWPVLMIVDSARHLLVTGMFI